jgi:sugar phosphate isomerase/epimerase
VANISFQLYSFRNFPPLSDTPKMVSELRFMAVEYYSGMMSDSLDSAALKIAPDKNNLIMPTYHIGLDQIQESPNSIISLARELGVENIYVPAVPESEKNQSSAGWTALGNALEVAAKPLLDAKLQVGWHNHPFEFATTDSNELPLDLILGAAKSLTWELDIVWAVIGDQDAMATINKSAERLSAAHIKDLASSEVRSIGNVVARSTHVMAHAKEHWHANPDFPHHSGAEPVLDIGPYYITYLVQLLRPMS